MISARTFKKVLYFLVGVLLLMMVADHWSHGRAKAFYFADDASAYNFLTSSCNPGGAKRTIHIVYATNAVYSGANLSFYLKAQSYNCGTTAAPNVSNTLTTFSPSGVAVPHVFYSGLSLPVNTATALYEYGPFTYSNLSVGSHTFSYSYTVTSYTDIAVGNSSFTVTVPPNNPPSGTITASCDAAGSLTVQTNTSDPENDNLSVTITLPDGTTHTGTGPGNYNFGSFASTQDGVAKQVTGTVKDASNPAVALAPGPFTCAQPQHNPFGNIVVADCSALSGSFSDQDHAGPYRIDIHFKDGPPSAYTNTYTTHTDGSNKFSFAIPAAYRGYNGGAATKVWIDGLGKDASGADSGWVGLGGSPQTIGPCLDASCNLVEYSLGGGGYSSIGNDATITTEAGQSLSVKVAWKNVADTGGIDWTNVGNNVGGAFDAGWDTTVGAPVNSSGGYNNASSARLRAESPGSMVPIGSKAVFYWDAGVLSTTGTYDQLFRMVHEDPGGAWFGSACHFTLKIKYAPITAGTIVTCDLSVSADFVEMGEPFDGGYRVNYTPTGNASIYPTIHVTTTSFSVTPGYPPRSGNPGDFTMDPVAGGSNQPVNFSPPAYVLNNAGIYALHGSFHVTAPDGIGGTTSFTVSCDGTKTVGNRPYMRVYGGDVLAGSSYGSPCTTVTSSIAGYVKRDGAGNWSGAGSQFGSFADGSITGFATAILAQPSAPSSLAFANTTPNLSLNPPLIGGSFGAFFCAQKYWPSTLPANGSSVLDATTNGEFSLPGGSILTQTAALSRSTKIYVDGDLTIGSNLVTTTSWASPDDIPSLYVIVKGNIHIMPGVHQLDGLFVAEPTAVSPTVVDGRIFTCYNSTDANTNSAFLANPANGCDSKLTINGALYAAKVNFLRTNGRLFASTPGEAASSANIAETIQLPPELLMSTPAGKPTNGSNNYDSIVGLSPSL